MPGRTGKRAKPPGLCVECGKPIKGDFNRDRDGDRHEECWWKKREAMKASPKPGEEKT